MKITLVGLVLSFAAILLACTSHYSQQKLSYTQSDICSILDSPPSESTVVQVKTLMTYSTVGRVDGGDPFFYSPKCNNEDYFAVADMKRTKLGKQHRSFIANLRSETDFIFEIVLEGRVQMSYFPIYGHLGWSRANIQVDKIVSIADISDLAGLRRPDSEATGPQIEQARYLGTLNREFLLDFLGISSSFKVDLDLAEDFEAVDSAGRNFNRSYLDVLAKNYRPSEGINTCRIDQPKGRMEGSRIIVTGNVQVETRQGDKRTIKYETTYVRQNQFLKLARFRIT